MLNLSVVSSNEPCNWSMPFIHYCTKIGNEGFSSNGRILVPFKALLQVQE